MLSQFDANSYTYLCARVKDHTYVTIWTMQSRLYDTDYVVKTVMVPTSRQVWIKIDSQWDQQEFSHVQLFTRSTLMKSICHKINSISQMLPKAVPSVSHKRMPNTYHNRDHKATTVLKIGTQGWIRWWRRLTKPLLIIEVLIKKEQASSETKLQQLEMGSRAPPHKKRWMEKD